MNPLKFLLAPSALALGLTQQHGAAHQRRREQSPPLHPEESYPTSVWSGGQTAIRSTGSGSNGRAKRRRGPRASSPGSHHHARFKKREKRRRQRLRA